MKVYKILIQIKNKQDHQNLIEALDEHGWNWTMEEV